MAEGGGERDVVLDREVEVPAAGVHPELVPLPEGVQLAHQLEQLLRARQEVLIKMEPPQRALLASPHLS